MEGGDVVSRIQRCHRCLAHVNAQWTHTLEAEIVRADRSDLCSTWQASALTSSWMLTVSLHRYGCQEMGLLVYKQQVCNNGFGVGGDCYSFQQQTIKDNLLCTGPRYLAKIACDLP